MRQLLPALLLLTSLASCGEALVERGYKGVPLFTFVGQIGSTVGPTQFSKPIRAAVFWHPEGEVDPTEVGDELIEQDAISVATRFPGAFELNVFETPPDIEWEPTDKPYRVGLILLYEDRNEDGRFQEGELVGGATNLVLLYVLEDIPAERSDTGVAWKAGYRAEETPMRCQFPAPSYPELCGAPLGQACSTDEQCGAGRCLLRDHKRDWPGGMCIVNASDCRPYGDVPPLRVRESLNGWRSVYPRRCINSDSCRFEAGYDCIDSWCVPGRPPELVLDPQFERSRLCAGDEEEEDDDG